MAESASKRGNGEGTIRFNESRDRWEGRLTVGINPAGKPIRRMVTGKTRSAVVKSMRELREAADAGRTPVRRDASVARYLEHWLRDIVPGTVSSSTLVQYEEIVRLYINPHVGTKKLRTLAPADVTLMLRQLADAGLSANTQRLARSVLRRALRRAEQEGLVARNAAAIADGVKVGASQGRTLTLDQARTLLAALDEERMGPAIVVALTLGLRRSELLGLAWDDVELEGERPTVTIRRSLKRIPKVGLELSDTKTAGSRRRIHLPGPTVAVLRTHRARMRKERLKLGPAWPATVLGADLVFRSSTGTAVDPDNFRNTTYRITERVLTPEGAEPSPDYRWGPHELRHSAASLLIAQGVPLKVVSEVLGHSSIRITADVYGHLLDDAGLVAADAMADLFAADKP